MRFSHFHLVALAVLGNATGVFSQEIPSPSQPSSQLSAPYPSNSVTQDYSKQFFSENTNSWANKIDTHDEVAPVVDTDDDAEADSNNLHQHVSRATDANWDEYVEKGNRLYTALENAVRTKNMIPDKFWTFHEWQKNRDKSETLPSEVGTAMDSDGIPSVVSDRYKYVEVTDPKGQTNYHGFFPVSSKPNAMVETFVSKGNGPGLELSEVAFQTAGMDLCGEEEEALLKQLEYIYKAQILNPLTKSIMRQAYANSCEQKDRIVFKSDTDEFKALLATPNGAMVPRMLIDHAGFFQKTVMEIRLYLDRNMMVFWLG